jgi:acyl-CoA thioesterase FadM
LPLGELTRALLKSGASVTASDVSEKAWFALNEKMAADGLPGKLQCHAFDVSDNAPGVAAVAPPEKQCGGLDILASDVIGLVVESHCKYHAPIEYPARLRVGLRVDKLGFRYVTYGLAVFGDAASGSDDAVAHGYFSHVFVDRGTRRPVNIPEGLRSALERLVAE